MTPLAVVLPILAPFAGSFVGVLARRLPRGESAVRPRSRCETCGRTLGPAEMVPVLSHLALGGRCRSCGAPIARDHLWIELAAVLPPALLLALMPGAPFALLAWGSVLGWWLLALALVDWRAWILPDALTLPLAVAALAWTAWWAPDALADHAAAAALAWAGLAGIAATYRRVRGRDGLGLGDAKLLAAGGAALGVTSLGPCLLLAAALALTIALLRHGRAIGRTTAVPFGPALSLAIFVIWVVGNA